MFIKNLFVLWTGLSITAYATGDSYEQSSAKKPLLGSWELAEEVIPERFAMYLADSRQNVVLIKELYPENVVVRPIGYVAPDRGQIEIKFSNESAPLVYEFSKHGPTTLSTKVTYDKVPDQAPYTLFTGAVVYFEEESFFVKLGWKKKDENGNVEYEGSGSYTFMVEGDTLLFTLTNINDPSKEHTPDIYSATYTRQ